MRKTTATGKWTDPGVPHRGWICVDMEDSGGVFNTCEMCEVQEIRFLHTMEHASYPGRLVCGCICAGHMEEDYAAARKREKVLVNRARRRLNWPDRAGWRVSARGNPYINVGRLNIVIYPMDNYQDRYGFTIKDRYHGDKVLIHSRKPLQDERAAVMRTFDAMLWLEDKGKT